jgi:SAM-dependent methyltransferase
MPAPRHYAAIFILCLALLALEIATARVLSVALFSHYAFVAVSLAMFGLGLGALAVFLAPRLFSLARVDALTIASLALFGIAAPLCTMAFLVGDVAQELSWEGFRSIGVAYTTLAVPFLFGGVGIAMLMTHGAAAIGRLYAADLLGASTGCLVVVAAMQVMPAPYVSLAMGGLVSVAALLLAVGRGWRHLPLPLIGVGLAAVLVMQPERLAMRLVKGVPADYSEYAVWNAFSRVSAFPYAGNAGGLAVGGADGGAAPETMMLDIDGTAWTPMMQWDGDRAALAFLRNSALYLAHHLEPDGDVLVIGTGGGRDLLAAQAFAQRSVLGLELNPLMRHIVEQRYGDYSGRPYTALGTQVIDDEARSYLARLDQRFDVIQLSLIDTFSLNASGGVVFSENYLYTEQAFREYFRHLEPDGILTVSRYFVPKYPLEMLRVLALARAAWAAEGVDDFAGHVVVVSQGISATALIKRSPFTAEELARIRALRTEMPFVLRYLPGQAQGNAELRAFLDAPDAAAFLAAYPFILDPPTDDRPFFFHFLRRRLAELPPDQADPFQMMKRWDEALALMQLLVAVVSVLAAVFFLGPLVLLARGAVRGAPPRTAAPLLLYFACLGYGFMMLEIPLMQRFILFLGYPVYALAVILFALLLFSGLGSLASNRIGAHNLPRVLVVIIAVGALYVWGVPHLIAPLMGLGIAAKIAVTVLVLAPLGLVLGMAYPLGIGRLTQVSDGLVAWAWGLNAALSVVASVLATYLGSRIGFSAAMATGVAAYGVGWVCVVLAARR